MKSKQVVAALALFAAATAGAQTIYRCGNSYGQEPCPGATLVQPVPQPSEAEVLAARDEVKREAQLASEMHAERRKDEAQARPAPAPTDAKKPGHAHPAKLAVAHASPKKQDRKPAKKKTA